MKYVSMTIGGVVLCIAIVFGLDFIGVKWYSFIEPQREEARRKVFEETQSYNHGMEQQLARYRLEYLRSKSDTEKKAIASTVRHMYGAYDANKLRNPQLRDFLIEVNNTY